MRANAFLFDPAEAYRLPQPDENGTPQPRDEPLAQNAALRCDHRLLPGESGGAR